MIKLNEEMQTFLDRQKVIVDRVKWFLTPVGIIMGIFATLFVFTYDKNMRSVNGFFLAGIIITSVMIAICFLIILLTPTHKEISNRIIQRWLIYSYYALIILILIIIFDLPLGMLYILTDQEEIVYDLFGKIILLILGVYIILILLSGLVYELRNKTTNTRFFYVFYPGAFFFIIPAFLISTTFLFLILTGESYSGIQNEEFPAYLFSVFIGLIGMVLDPLWRKINELLAKYKIFQFEMK